MPNFLHTALFDRGETVLKEDDGVVVLGRKSPFYTPL